MEINIEAKYNPEAGDVLSWKSGGESILFIVVENEPDKITGLAIRDNRENLDFVIPHVVLFSHYADTNHRLALELRARHVDAELANLIETWDA